MAYDFDDVGSFEFRRGKAFAQLDQYKRYRGDADLVPRPPIFYMEIYGEIREGSMNSAAAIERQIGRHPNAKAAELLINSPGGATSEAMKIYDLLRKFPGLVSTRAEGMCLSAGTLILLAGGSRECASDTVFLVHQSEASPEQLPEGRWTTTRHQKVAEILAKVNAEMAHLYAFRTGGDIRAWKSELLNEKGFTAQKAKQLGLIHRIYEK